jgi:protease YdgD
MKHVLLLLLFGMTVVMAGPLASGQDLRPGIIGEDDRVRLDAKGPPWDAIGQVNIVGFDRIDACTGTLTAANLAITAAHCVMNPWKKTPYPLHDIHFVAGVRGEAIKGHAKARCLHFRKDYAFVPPEKILPTKPAQEVRISSFATDVVAIVLDRKLGVAPVPLAEDVTPEPGLPLLHVAYPMDHRFMPWAHVGCHLLLPDPEQRLWFNDCDTYPGSSGGPLFVSTDGPPRLAAIMVGGGEDEDNEANIALPISEWLELTRDTTCP